jgi:S-formylglutathione hydrolase
MRTPGLEETRVHKQFGGFNRYYSHPSDVCRHKMSFAAYVPPQASERKLPAVYFLSGLTCSEEIFMTEAQAQAHARKHELILVVPDTSPRGTGIEGEDDSYDLGSGAGFYVDATQPRWARHFQMDSYVTQELREIAERELPIDGSRRGIFGHSMGGHGALVLGLRNPHLYRSISAFAPICAPSRGPWGIKAFTEYLGTDRAAWARYDATELLKHATTRTPILIDQGTDDEFLERELFTDAFERAVKETSYPATIRRQAGYDHSYFFISTFMEDHLAFHARHLRASSPTEIPS